MKHLLTRNICLTVALFVVWGFASVAWAEGTSPTRLTFVYTRPREHPVTQWLILIYTEALKRMNIEFAFQDVPPKRASAYSDEGLVDGELGRVFTYNETHPHLLRVEEHHALLTFTAFVSDPDVVLDGWDSLKDTSYTVECRRGIKKCEVQLPRVLPPEQLSEIGSVHQGIQKLLAGRTQVYIDVEDLVLKYLHSDEFELIRKGRTVYKAGIMEQTSGHAFLHNTHQALISELSAMLRDMKEEGLFEAYREQVGLTPFDITW